MKPNLYVPFVFLSLVCAGFLFPADSWSQTVLASPEDAGIVSLSGDVPIGRGYGNTHKYAAAWPAIMPNGMIVIGYPRPTDENLQARMSYVDVLDRTGTVVESRPGWQDDAGTPIVVREDIDGDLRGVMVDASRSGASMYVVACRLAPWKYQGPLESWGNGTLTLPDGGVPAVQVYAADGTALSPIVNVWPETLLGDDGEIRGRHAVFLSDGNIALNWWDRKAGVNTGFRWADEGYTEYEGTGNVVGVAIVQPDGTVVLSPKPISAPDPAGGGAQSMRGLAAGDGWFSCRVQDPPDNVIRYKILDNAGNLLHNIAVADALAANGMAADVAVSVAGGRGDSELPWGQGRYLYTIGGGGGHTYVAKWNALSGTLEAVVQASENAGFAGERMDVCTDPAGNIFATWGDQSWGGAADMEIVGRFFNPDLTPASPSFAVFENANVAESDGYQWKDCSARMDAGLVVVTCHTDALPDNVLDWGESGLEHVARLLENPFEPSYVESSWELY